MEKGKGMSKAVIIVILTLLIVVAAVVVIVINSRPQKVTARESEFNEQAVRKVADEGEENLMGSGKGYVENQVIAVADSKREAKKIAKQIGGELVSYDNQVAIIQIGITVEEMMQKLEEDSSLPKVYPNYQDYQSYTN